jgi:nucleotide-binding universal stress UspA family protein
MREDPMFKNILLAVDGTNTAEHAAREGIRLARRLGAKVTILTVTVPWETYFARELAVVVPDAVVPRSEYDRKRDAAAADVTERIRAQALSAALECVSVHDSHPHPYEAIVGAAARSGCDLIVTGSRCHGGLAGLLGSETMKVLTHTSVPVLVFRPETMTPDQSHST